MLSGEGYVSTSGCGKWKIPHPDVLPHLRLQLSLKLAKQSFFRFLRASSQTLQKLCLAGEGFSNNILGLVDTYLEECYNGYGYKY